MLMLILFLIGILGLYGLYLTVSADTPNVLRAAWKWLNPYSVKTGVVLGSALRYEEWKKRTHALAIRSAKRAEEQRAEERAAASIPKHKTWNDSLNADIDAKLNEMMTRVDTRRAGAFHRVQDENTIDGEISGGVESTPQDYADRFGRPKTETERTLEKLKQIREASDDFKTGF